MGYKFILQRYIGLRIFYWGIVFLLAGFFPEVYEYNLPMILAQVFSSIGSSLLSIEKESS